MKLTELAKQPQRGQSILLYGAPKSGKTIRAASIAKHFKRVIWLDLENGIQAVINSPTLTQEEKSHIEVLQLPDTQTNPIAITTVMKILSGNKTEVCEKHGVVNCLSCKKDSSPFMTFEMKAEGTDTVLVVDSLTQLSLSATAQVCGPDLDKATDIRNFGRSNDRLSMCLSFIQQAPYHTIFISHENAVEDLTEKNTKDKTDVEVEIVPFAGTKAFSRNVAKFFGHVLYCEHKPSGFVVGSMQNYNNSILTGNRANIKWDANTQLADFLRVVSAES